MPENNTNTPVSKKSPAFLVFIALVTLALEAWMITEALLMWPRAKGVLEEALPPLGPSREFDAATAGGRSC